MSGLQTEFELVLPKGFVDGDGRLHRTARIRLATARDELEPLRDPRIEGPDDPLLTVLVLSRVVTALGTVSPVDVEHIENLFAVDLAFLQDVYGIVNFGSPADIASLLDSQRDALAELQALTAPVAEPAAAVPSDDEVEVEMQRMRLEEVGASRR